MANGFMYADVYEFQKKHKTKAEREKVLKTLSDREIWHLAKTSGNATGGAYYAKHLKDPNYGKDKE